MSTNLRTAVRDLAAEVKGNRVAKQNMATPSPPSPRSS